MALPRKPLITPGKYLAPTPVTEEGPSLQERIIARDAEKHGRSAPTNITSNITAHIPEHEDGQKEEQVTAPTAARRRIQASPQSGRRVAAKVPAQKNGKEPPWSKARKMAASTAIPITLRLSSELNDYLDDQQHQHRKSGVKKQDLVSLAVQLLVVKIESGADVVALLRGEEEG